MSEPEAQPGEMRDEPEPEPVPHPGARLPAGYAGGPVNLLKIGAGLRDAHPDAVEFDPRRRRMFVAGGLAVLAGIVALFALVAVMGDASDGQATMFTVSLAATGLLAAWFWDHWRPRHRARVQRARWIIAALLRTSLMLSAALTLFASVGAAAVRISDPLNIAKELGELQGGLALTAVVTIGLMLLLTLRTPALHIDPRGAWVHSVSKPLPTIVMSVASLSALAVGPALPAFVRGETTAAVSTIAAVAAVVAAILAAWASIALTVRQQEGQKRQHLASSLLSVADAARRVTAGQHGARDELDDALARLSNDLLSRRTGLAGGNEFADQGVRLVIDAVAREVTGRPLPPESARYERSIDHFLGRPDEERLVAGLEALCRELALRVQSNRPSTEAQFRETLAALDAQAQR